MFMLFESPHIFTGGTAIASATCLDLTTNWDFAVKDSGSQKVFALFMDTLCGVEENFKYNFGGVHLSTRNK